MRHLTYEYTSAILQLTELIFNNLIESSIWGTRSQHFLTGQFNMPVTQYLVCCSQDILHLLARGQSKPTAPARGRRSGGNPDVSPLKGGEMEKTIKEASEQWVAFAAHHLGGACATPLLTVGDGGWKMDVEGVLAIMAGNLSFHREEIARVSQRFDSLGVLTDARISMKSALVEFKLHQRNLNSNRYSISLKVGEKSIKINVHECFGSEAWTQNHSTVEVEVW